MQYLTLLYHTDKSVQTRVITALRKLPTVLTTIYLILVALAIMPIFTGDGPLSSIFAFILDGPLYGIFAYILTLPWSVLLSHLSPGNSIVLGLLIIAISAAINAAILYFVSHWLVGLVVK